jgi:putative FmdB family regulatory protein
VPIYEFVCETCGRLTEVMQRVSDPPPESCAGCGAAKLSRVVSRTSFQLKGGGWYSDLYASPKKNAGATGSEPAGAAASAPAAKGTDAKTEAKGTDAKGGGASPKPGGSGSSGGGTGGSTPPSGA